MDIAVPTMPSSVRRRRESSSVTVIPAVNKRVLSIDFDGVLHNNPTDKTINKMGEPILGAREAMLKLKSLGFWLTIYTVRGSSPDHVEEWLRLYDIPYDQVTNIKLSALAYLDDKAVRFTDWDTALKELTHL